MIHRASEATGDGRAPWGRLLVLCGVLALHNAMRIGPVTFIEELRGRYGVDYAGAGNVVGAYTLAYGFAQLLAGLLADRVGSRRLMLVGLGLGAAGSATFAVTEGYCGRPRGASPDGGRRRLPLHADDRLHVRRVPIRAPRARDGLRGSRGRRGTGPGPARPPDPLSSDRPHAGVPGAFRPPRWASASRWRSRSRRSRRRPTPPGARIRDLARERDFWLLAVGFAFVGMLAQVAVLAWMPTYLRQVHAFGVVGAGLSTGIVVTGLMLFSPVFGILSDRLTARRPVMLVGCLLALAGFVVLLVTSPSVGRRRRGAPGQRQHGRHDPDAGRVRVGALPGRRLGHGHRPREHRRADRRLARRAALRRAPRSGPRLRRGVGIRHGTRCSCVSWLSSASGSQPAPIAAHRRNLDPPRGPGVRSGPMRRPTLRETTTRGSVGPGGSPR